MAGWGGAWDQSSVACLSWNAVSLSFVACPLYQPRFDSILVKIKALKKKKVYECLCLFVN